MKTQNIIALIFFAIFAIACGTIDLPTNGKTITVDPLRHTETVVIQATAIKDYGEIYIVHDNASYDMKNHIARTWGTTITQVVDGPHQLEAFCDNAQCTQDLTVSFNGFAGCLQDGIWHYSSPVTGDGCKAEPVTEKQKWIFDDEFPVTSFQEQIPVIEFTSAKAQYIVSKKMPTITLDSNCIEVPTCMENAAYLADNGVLVRPYLDYLEIPVYAGYTAERPLVRLLREILVSDPAKHESYFVHNEEGDRVCVWPDTGLDCSHPHSLWLLDQTNPEAMKFIVDFYYEAMKPYLDIFKGLETDRLDGFCHWHAGAGHTLKLFNGLQGTDYMAIDQACQDGNKTNLLQYVRSKYGPDFIITGRTNSHEYCADGLLDGVTYEVSFEDDLGNKTATQINKLQDFMVIKRLGLLSRSCRFVTLAHYGDDAQRERTLAVAQLYDNVLVLHDGGVSGHQGATYDQLFYKAPGKTLEPLQDPWKVVHNFPDTTMTESSNRLDYPVKAGQVACFTYRLYDFVDGESLILFSQSQSITEWNWSFVCKLITSDQTWSIEYTGPGKAVITDIFVYDPGDSESTGYFHARKENLEPFYSVRPEGVNVTDSRGNTMFLANRTGWISH